MTQTVALQRGTTTVNGNGTSSATLFTQSGGIATRVIPSQLSFYSSGTASSVFNITLYHTTSGGQTHVIGQLGSSNGFSIYATQFNIENTGETLHRANSSGVYGNLQIQQLPANGILWQASSSGDMGSSVPNESFSSINSGGTQTIFRSYLPSNFWIGPGDSLSIKSTWAYVSGKSLSYRTVNISYSFVTITES